MEKKFSQPEKDADPHTFSPVPKNIQLEETGKKVPHSSQDYPVYIDPATGDKYIEKLEKYSPPTLEKDSRKERFITLLIKGVLRSSDFIEKDGRFFSKVIDTDKTSTVKEGELQADLFILENLLGDFDHVIIRDKKNLRAFAKDTGLHDKNVEEHSNLIVKKKKFVHFDYHNAQIYPSSETVNSEGWFKKTATYNIQHDLVFLKKENYREIFKEIIKKIQEIKNRLSDKSFFDGIIKESKIPLEDSSESIRGGLLKKADILLDVINELGDKKNGK